MLNKKIGFSISVLVMTSGLVLVGCENKLNYKEDVVILEEQKTSIDQNIVVKSVKNFDEFEGDRWWNDELILGVKNQPVKGREGSEASIEAYNVNKEEFNTLVKGKKNEWLMLGESFKNQLIYLSLIDGDFKKNLYDFNILDMDTYESKEIMTSISSMSELKNDILYISKGMEFFIYSFDSGLEEIKLPKELISELENFENYSFEDYLEMYYKYDDLNESQKKQIRENYEYSKANNKIRILNNLGDEVRFESSNGKVFNYNIKNKTYEPEETFEKTKKDNNLIKDKDKVVERVHWEHMKDGTKVLWKMDLSGNKDKVIEYFSSNFDMAVSPDGNKLVYTSRDEYDTKSSFIYDLNTDEKIKIFPDTTGRIYWNKESDKVFISGRKFDLGNLYTNITSLIELK